MPQIQLGVYLADGKEAFQSVLWALEVSSQSTFVGPVSLFPSRLDIEGTQKKLANMDITVAH
jgi:hypothetical protein